MEKDVFILGEAGQQSLNDNEQYQIIMVSYYSYEKSHYVIHLCYSTTIR